MKRDILADMNVERAARRACVLITDVSSGDQYFVRAGDMAAPASEIQPFMGLLTASFGNGKSSLHQVAGRDYFFTVHVPPPRIIVIGAVHISQALEPMARMVGFDTIIIDPRMAFATTERFPGMNLVPEWPHEAIPRVGLDHYTAFVALTHDPKVDDPGLTLALQSNCFYIGALGSRKTHGRRVERLTSAGFTAPDIQRIHAPIGLNIGALSPAEIALSILAEIVGAYRQDSSQRKAA